MTNINELSDEALAQELAQRKTSLQSEDNADANLTLLHDLQVHQIELEMQNRELRDSQLLMEQMRDQYSDLYDFSPIGYASFDHHGSVLNIIYQLLGGIRSSMGYTGCANIPEMRTKPEFVRVTGAGMSESHVHDVTITKEAPNYRRN